MISLLLAKKSIKKLMVVNRSIKTAKIRIMHLKKCGTIIHVFMWHHYGSGRLSQFMLLRAVQLESCILLPVDFDSALADPLHLNTT